jgi:hypothetical protein
LEFGPSCTYRANQHESKCVGENTFGVYSKELAFALGYTNPNTNTGHGSRVGGISLVSNSKCGPGTLLGFSRHSNLKMTSGYHHSDMNDKLCGSFALQKMDADKIVMDGNIGKFIFYKFFIISINCLHSFNFLYLFLTEFFFCHTLQINIFIQKKLKRRDVNLCPPQPLPMIRIRITHYLTIPFILRHHMIPSILKQDLPPWRVNTLYLVLLSTEVRPLCIRFLLTKHACSMYPIL